MAPLQADMIVCEAAEALGMKVQRRDGFRIVSERALKAAGLTKEAPDWLAIRKLLDQGATVEGVERTGMEYTLRLPKPEEEKADA